MNPMNRKRGFDIFPPLEPDTYTQMRYQAFLNEIISFFGKYIGDGNLLDYSPPGFLDLTFGSPTECSRLPKDPAHCNYFRRFSITISGETTDIAELCFRKVQEIAQLHFRDRVWSWHELTSSGDAWRRNGKYKWADLHENGLKLEVVVAERAATAEHGAATGEQQAKIEEPTAEEETQEIKVEETAAKVEDQEGEVAEKKSGST